MSNETTVLRPGQRIKATLDLNEVRELLLKYHGLIAGKIIELNAYDDRNYKIENSSSTTIVGNLHASLIPENGYIFKIVNSLDSRDEDFYAAQTELLLYLRCKSNILCPIPVKQKDGKYFSTVTLKSGENKI